MISVFLRGTERSLMRTEFQLLESNVVVVMERGSDTIVDVRVGRVLRRVGHRKRAQVRAGELIECLHVPEGASAQETQEAHARRRYPLAQRVCHLIGQIERLAIGNIIVVVQ